VFDACRQDEAVAGSQLDREGVGPDPERDRACRAHQQLRVSVSVRRVLVTRTVAPGVWIDALVAQPRGDTFFRRRLGFGPAQLGRSGTGAYSNATTV
jgi:hypothetical protein